MFTPRLSMFTGIYRKEAKVARFLLSLVLFGIAYGLYRGIQDNYLAEIIHISPFERGIVEFFREIPGLLIIFILALMYRYSESRIFKIGMALALGGLIGLLVTSTEFLRTKFLVVLFLVLFSLGENIMMPVKSTISMDIAKREKAGASLGITSSLTQLGSIAGFFIVMLVFFLLSRQGVMRTDILGYRIVFGVACALMVVSTLTVLAIKETTLKNKRQRFYFARKFHKYYMMEVFYGARKQVFLTFAPYVLILHYGADPSIMSLLYAVCAGAGIFCGPLTGRIIDKLGYKTVMVADTLILVVVCLLYGFSHKLFPKEIAFFVVCANFVMDSIISIASMANHVYVQRVAVNQEEVTATLSTGLSVNHLISIVIALIGGWIWKVTGIELLFTLSAVLGLISSIYAATIKKSEEYAPGIT